MKTKPGEIIDLSKGKIKFLDCVNFVRAVRVSPTLRPSWLTMAYPHTMTLAYCDHADKTRTLYYVRTDTWRTDGISWRLAAKRHRQSVIVDSQRLGPVPKRRPRRAFSIEQRAYLAHHLAETRKQWGDLLAQRSQDSPATVEPQRFRPRRSVVEVALASEQSIVWTDGGPSNHLPLFVAYAIEAWMYPGPGIINAIPAGHYGNKAWEILGYAKVNLATQADAGLSKFIQRVWIADWSRELNPSSNFYFGGSMPPAKCQHLVDPAEAVPGILTPDFDRRSLPPISPTALDYLSSRRLKWRTRERGEHDPYLAE